MKNIGLVLIALSFSITAFADNAHTLTIAFTQPAAASANDQQTCKAFAATTGDEFEGRNPQLRGVFPFNFRFTGTVQDAGHGQTYCRVTIYEGCDYYIYGYPAFQATSCTEDHAVLMQRLHQEHPMALDLFYEFKTVTIHNYHTGLDEQGCEIHPILIAGPNA